MERFKRLFSKHRHWVIYLMEVVVLIIGCYVAYLTVRLYAPLVRAVLGLTTWYWIYREYVVLKSTHDSSVFFREFKFPEDLKYIAKDFIVMILVVWAGVQLLDLIRYLIQWFAG